MADQYSDLGFQATPAVPPNAHADLGFTPAASAVKNPGYLSQVGTGIWNTVKGLAEVGNAGFHLATDNNNPLAAAEHLRTLKRLIVDPQVGQAIQAADKWKAGDRSEAVGHALASIIPGAGPAAANIGEKFGSGDIKGGLADATVLGSTMAIPHVAGPVARVAGKVAGQVADSAGSVGSAAMEIAANPAVREAVGVFSPRLKSALEVVNRVRRGKDAYQAYRAANAPEATVAPPASAPTIQAKALLGPGPVITAAPPDASFVRSVPAEYPTVQQPPVPQPRGLLNAPSPAPIITPPPADASFVRSVPAQYPQVETPVPVANAPTAAAPLPPAATAAVDVPAEDMATLDGLAQELNKTSFAKASPESQAMIRALVPRLNQPIPAELNAPPPVAAPRAPMAAPEAAAPSRTFQQLVQEDLAARRAPAPAAPASRPPAQSAPSLAEQLRDEMRSSGSYQEPAPEAPAVPYNPPGRATNAANLAKVFHQHGISVEDAKTIPLDDPTWKNLSDSLGQKRPSKETVEATLVELRRLEKSAAAKN